MAVNTSKDGFAAILHCIKMSEIYNEAKTDVLADFQGRKHFSADDESIKRQIYDALCKRSVYNKIRNQLNQLVERPQIKPWNEQNAIDKIQARWLKRAQKGLHNMCSDLKLPLSKKRLLSDRIKIEEKWSELGTVEELDTEHLRPVYSSKDMLEFIKSIDSQSVGLPVKAGSTKKIWQALGDVPCPVPSFRELQSQFKDLSGSKQPSSDSDRQKLGMQVLNFGDSIVAQNFCRQGCPTGLREKIWQLALQSEPTQKDFLAFKCFKEDIFNWDTVSDRLAYKDVKETASNDDQYFVFEDLLYQMLLVFFRKKMSDTVGTETSLIRKHVIPMKKADPSSVPPPGSDNPSVIPFFGFSYHAAPLCFVTTGPVRCLKMFSKMQEKYFYKLQRITNDFQSIICLTKLFEELLAKQEHKLSEHFEENNLNPTTVAFKWMMRAFAGHLDSEQVLILWDRIIGFSSLVILPNRRWSKVRGFDRQLSRWSGGRRQRSEEVERQRDRRPPGHQLNWRSKPLTCERGD